MSAVWAIITEEMSAASVVGVAVRTNEPVKALVFGLRELAQHVSALGVEAVEWFDSEKAVAENEAASVAQKAAQEKPFAVVSSSQATARAIAGAVAVSLRAAVASDVIAVRRNGDVVEVERLVADNEAVEVLDSNTPVVVTIADGVAEAEPAGEASVEEGNLTSAPALEVLATNLDAGGANGLASAEKVVGVGLGIGAKENLQLINDLAEALGAEVACTLPLCDNYHWFEHNRVVGTSTQKISPRLYMTFGSSGAPQHMTGVRNSKLIVAVNNDAEAPIFRACAYGIVGDAAKILPVLTQAVKQL